MKQAAKFLGVDQQTLYRWIWDGKVQSIHRNAMKIQALSFTDDDASGYALQVSALLGRSRRCKPKEAVE